MSTVYHAPVMCTMYHVMSFTRPISLFVLQATEPGSEAKFNALSLLPWMYMSCTLWTCSGSARADHSLGTVSGPRGPGSLGAKEGVVRVLRVSIAHVIM